ncbi:MAG TPA: orotate phosphoribosyltransferase [Candidatus Goldiibacteriota bacterium]|nr:orotate phosphoribosyltransferase [Candidatus Goldiibacteriota bacterium]
MNQEKVLNVFRKTNALLAGHFLLTSGKHSNIYLEKFMVLQYPEHTEKLAKEIAGHFKNKKPDVVIGAAVGGIILSYEVARQIGARGIFMEREEGKLTLRRNFEIKKGEKVLVVEDIVTTGGSVRELITSLKEYECEIVGVGVLINRSGEELDFGIDDTFVLATVDVNAYDPDDCPLCKRNVPLTSRGSKYLKKNVR